MGNISKSLRKVLKQTKTKNNLKKELKDLFLPSEYKHITNFRIYKNKLIFYLDSSIALYQLELRKEEVFKKMKDKGLPYLSLGFRI